MTFAHCLYKRATHWVGVLGHLIASWRFLALAAGLTLAACSGSDSGSDPRPGLGAGLPGAVAPAIPFSFMGSQFQSYTVPVTGWYFLDAQGAQGGAASNGSHQGGKGAWMQGYAYLQQGAVLRIAVGGAGGVGQNDRNNVSGGGGGGASSIVLVSGSVEVPSSSDIPLLIAGGGGGAAANYDGSPGLTSERAGSPNEGGNGNGAGVGADPYGGAGGAGYRTDGGTHLEGGSGSPVLSQGGQAYLNGNSGGASSNRGGNGGWGGGGEGGPAVSSLTKNRDGGGGGGGGYSGGGGGVNQGDSAGGGGSYVSSQLDTSLSLAVPGYRSGDGLVEITPVNGSPVITQPKDQQVAIGQQAVTLGPVYDDPTGQTTYQWMKDGVVLVGQTSATLTIASFQFTDSGGYQAIVRQGNATSITLPAFLSALPQSTLQSWGWNQYGQVGLGDTNDRDLPVQVTSDVVAIAGGQYSSLFIKRDGTLWAVGRNNYGQLGLGDTNDRSSPVQVAGDVVAVAAGSDHSLFVKRDGTLWSMGKNNKGQLGVGDTVDRTAPVQVARDVVAVAVGGLQSLFVKRDGTLWGMGNNGFGELGQGAAYSFNEPSYPSTFTSPVRVTDDVVAVAAGDEHSLFLKRDGTLYGMGDNSWSQLGKPYDPANPALFSELIAVDVKAVAAGDNHSLFVERDGSLWGMGEGDTYQLGLGYSSRYNYPPARIAGDVVAVAGGSGHSLFVKSDGTLWAMGYNAFSQLGLGDQTTRRLPTQVYFRNSANQPTAPLVVATLAKMPKASHSLAISAPAP